MQPRPYQVRAIDAIWHHYDGGRDPICSMATGLGKTVVIAMTAKRIAEATSGRVLIQVHREELADQIENALRRVDPDHPPGREQGDSHADGRMTKPRYVVAMVQTLTRKNKLKNMPRLEQFAPRDFAAVITDEGHHGVAPMYKLAEKHFRQNPACRFLGFSATWIDAAGEGIGFACGYNSVAFKMGVREGIDEGWLVRARAFPIHVTGIEWDKVKATADGVYDLDALDDILSEEGPFHELTLAVREQAGNRPTIVFGPGKKWVHAAYAVFHRYESANVREITDDLRDKAARKAVFDDFRAGLYGKLLNCGIVSEGVDLPNASCAAICRPCQSERLAAQIVGRVLRPAEGLLDALAHRDRLWSDTGERLAAIAASSKPNAKVLDFASRGARKLLTCADILGSDLPRPVVEYAKRIQEKEGQQETDVIAILDRATVEWALIQEEIERRSKVKAVGVAYETREVDLFDPRINNVVDRPTPKQAEPPSANQVWYITHNLGWSEAKAKNMSKKAASAIIAKHKRGEIKAKQ